MNKKAEEAGGKAWGKIVTLILVIAVLVLVLWALFFGNIPGWLNNLIPDFFKNHKDNSALKIQQANILERLKSLDCLSPDKNITLMYKTILSPNDLFEVRYNTELRRPQVYMWPNNIVNKIKNSVYGFFGKSKPKADSKEWLIYAADLGGMYNIETQDLEAILGADSKDFFITSVTSVVNTDPNLYINLGSGDKNIITEQEIKTFLEDPTYPNKYNQYLKTAPDKCKPPTPAII
jgi:hypothetical protein